MNYMGVQVTCNVFLWKQHMDMNCKMIGRNWDAEKGAKDFLLQAGPLHMRMDYSATVQVM